MNALGIRSGSYGSLDKNGQNGLLPIQYTTRSKPSKMFKDKEGLTNRISKLVGRKKLGLLLLFMISMVVFVWMLSIGKGEDTQEVEQIQNISFNSSVPSLIIDGQSDYVSNQTLRDTLNAVEIFPPPPPSHFLGYTLPIGHPCNTFTLPPPPADKKRSGPRPCPVCYLPVDEAIALMPKVPSYSPVVKNLTYIYEEPLNRETEFGGSDFGGYPTLKHRADSYDIRESMDVHCGFVQGPKPGRGTGFDMDEVDLLEMEQCRGVVVASAVFGAFDEIQQPKNISQYSKDTVCFYMFVDEKTEAYLKNQLSVDVLNKVGLWRVVVIHNLPYTDGRRNGKVPKLLVHRIFPNARFSLWVDGKLELVADPYQILERFLWRKNATFAISKHYKRFDVFTEAEANKVAGKYDNTSIDFQIDFYKKEGLMPYSPAKLPITSDVPEGCVIMREHVPISNLFTCLWFNEVDRFTSRDQISFSTVRDKIAAKTKWTLNMFMDCERRNFVVQKHHLADLAMLAKRRPPPQPQTTVNGLPRKMSLEISGDESVATTRTKNDPLKHGKDRKSGSKRHPKIVTGL